MYLEFLPGHGKWSFIDKKGKEVIKPKYAEIYSEFSEGLAAVSNFDKYGSEMNGYIDKTGKEILKLDYDFGVSAFNNGYAVVPSGGEYSFYIIANPLSKSNQK